MNILFKDNSFNNEIFILHPFSRLHIFASLTAMGREIDMTLYSTIAISLLVFLIVAGVYILSAYLGFRISNKNTSNSIKRKIPRRRGRKGKYILNNFTAQIFFGEYSRGKRIKVLNGSSPLTTEKYSFTKTKLFDN